MAEVHYRLTCRDDFAGMEWDANGNIVIIFKCKDFEEEDLSTADYAGDTQSDLLWELFDHDFRSYDDEGVLIEYADNGERK